MYLRPADGTTMNRRRVLADAKAKALSLVDGYEPPEKPEIALPGATGMATLRMVVDDIVRQGKATGHDRTVAFALGGVLTGGETDTIEIVNEDQLLALERSAFMSLIRQPKTLDRIEHMLDTGKPLRN
jgi:3-hydroxyacyl-CoA dehydrogenase